METSRARRNSKAIGSALKNVQQFHNEVAVPVLGKQLGRLRRRVSGRPRPLWRLRVIAKQFGIYPGTVQRVSRPFEGGASAGLL